ncbi:MAG: hypothetical protein AAFU77_09200 [Myxococcota bacterium]
MKKSLDTTARRLAVELGSVSPNTEFATNREPSNFAMTRVSPGP